MPLNNMTVAISSEINAFTKNTGARPGSMDMSIPIYRAWTEELSRGDTSGNEYSLMSHLHNIFISTYRNNR